MLRNWVRRKCSFVSQLAMHTENNTDQTHSCPRECRLLAIMCAKFNTSWYSSEHQNRRGLSGALNWVHIMPRDGSFSDSGYIFFQSGSTYARPCIVNFYSHWNIISFVIRYLCCQTRSHRKMHFCFLLNETKSDCNFHFPINFELLKWNSNWLRTN